MNLKRLFPLSQKGWRRTPAGYTTDWHHPCDAAASFPSCLPPPPPSPHPSPPIHPRLLAPCGRQFRIGAWVHELHRITEFTALDFSGCWPKNKQTKQNKKTNETKKSSAGKNGVRLLWIKLASNGTAGARYGHGSSHLHEAGAPI